MPCTLGREIYLVIGPTKFDCVLNVYVHFQCQLVIPKDLNYLNFSSIVPNYFQMCNLIYLRIFYFLFRLILIYL